MSLRHHGGAHRPGRARGGGAGGNKTTQDLKVHFAPSGDKKDSSDCEGEKEREKERRKNTHAYKRPRLDYVCAAEWRNNGLGTARWQLPKAPDLCPLVTHFSEKVVCKVHWWGLQFYPFLSPFQHNRTPLNPQMPGGSRREGRKKRAGEAKGKNKLLCLVVVFFSPKS